MILIKKIQQLKNRQASFARKGFTLVELIVVISIIGVLAAILIPTMLAYVTAAKISNLDTTVVSLKNDFISWYTEKDGTSADVNRSFGRVGSTPGANVVIYWTTPNKPSVVIPGCSTDPVTTGLFKTGNGPNLTADIENRMGELYPRLNNTGTIVYFWFFEGSIEAGYISNSAPAGSFNGSNWTGINGSVACKTDGLCDSGGAAGNLFGSYPRYSGMSGDI